LLGVFDVVFSGVILLLRRWFWRLSVAPATVSVVSVTPVRLLVGTEMAELVVGVVVWWWWWCGGDEVVWS
jgi:hypothetical protein